MTIDVGTGIARILKQEGVEWVSTFPVCHVNNALGREGVDIALTYFRNRAAAEETAGAIRAVGSQAYVIQADLADIDDIEKSFETVKDTLGSLDILVSNAVSAILRPAVELPRRHWDHILSANLTAFFECSQRSVELMTGSTGKIIAISSLGSRRYTPGYAALGVAKAGIETLARYLAVELAPRGINVNVVCPGLVDTDALGAFSSVVPSVDDFKRELIEKTPGGRIGAPEDVGRLVVFLCSAQADWIRGQTITVDGGLSLLGA